MAVENENKTLKKNLEEDNKDKALSKKVIELTGQIEDLKHSITKKNVQI